MRYYLLLNGEIKGPLQIMTVREMLSAGAIQESTLMAQEGADGWQPAATVLAQAVVSDQSRISSPSASAQNPKTSNTGKQSRYLQVGSVLAAILMIWAYSGATKAKKGKSVTTSKDYTEDNTGCDNDRQSAKVEVEKRFEIRLDKKLFFAYLEAYQAGPDFDRRAHQRGLSEDMTCLARSIAAKQIASANGCNTSEDSKEFLFIYRAMEAGGSGESNCLIGINPNNL